MAKGKEIDQVKSDAEVLLGNVAPAVEDSDAMRRSIIERNLAAQTDDDLFAEAQSVPTRDLVGIPLLVESVRLAEGEIDGEPTTYMLIDAINLDTGEKILANSGAPQVVSKLFNLHSRGRLPMQVFVAEAAPARQGRNAVLTLRRVESDLPVPPRPGA
jgi:hypothetical protein